MAYDYDDFGVTRSIGDSALFNEICYTGGIYDPSGHIPFVVNRLKNRESSWSKNSSKAKSVAKSASPVSRITQSQLHTKEKYGYSHYHSLKWKYNKKSHKRELLRINEGHHSFYGPEYKFH